MLCRECPYEFCPLRNVYEEQEQNQGVGEQPTQASALAQSPPPLESTASALVQGPMQLAAQGDWKRRRGRGRERGGGGGIQDVLNLLRVFLRKQEQRDKERDKKQDKRDKERDKKQDKRDKERDKKQDKREKERDKKQDKQHKELLKLLCRK